MDNPLTMILLLALLVVAGIAIWLYQQKRKTEALQERFGPEYGQVVRSEGDQHRAEAALEARARRVEQLQIRPLSVDERNEFSERWHATQAQFVDDPEAATREADDLVGEVMQVRGYPIGDFQQRADDVSVDHPHVVEHYRAAHAIAERNDAHHADTEELRTAFVHYRALFDDLLETDERIGTDRPVATEVRR